MKYGLLIAGLLLVGCTRQPESYRPPMQRRPLVMDESSKLSHFIFMNAPGAERQIVSGMAPGLNDGNWRWTLRKPEFQFQVPTTKGLSLKADITVPQVTFKDTGPVKISIFLENHLMDTLDFQKDEQRTWQKPVPPEWLTTDRPVIVSMEIDKLWKSPADGAERGFILTSLGFVQ